jgi:hypothetical protein
LHDFSYIRLHKLKIKKRCRPLPNIASKPNIN